VLKKSITFTDFNGDEVTEDHYFNLTKAELVELEMSHEGGLKESLENVVAAEDGGRIIEEMKKIIMKAYGKRSADGKRFIKTEDLRQEFESSEAYSELFMEMVTKADAAAEFVVGIMPKGMVDDNQEVLDLQQKTAKALGTDRFADGVEIRDVPHRVLSRKEIVLSLKRQ
jgi:hypothetical protein